jgi:hypothetical protein
MLLDDIWKAGVCLSVSLLAQTVVLGDSTVADPAQALKITTVGLDDGYPGIPYILTMKASGGVAPLKWAIVQGSGSLPPGLTLNRTTGLISGTPSAASAHAFSFTVQVADSSSPPRNNRVQLSMNILYGFTTSPVPLSFFGMILYDQNDWPQPPPNGAGVQVGALGKGIAVSWPFMQPTRGSNPNWSVLDQYVAAAQANGPVDIYYTPFNFPPWAVPNPSNPNNCQTYNTNPPVKACTNMVSNIDDWANFVTALVTRYKGAIRTYELYNEPSQPNSFTGSIADMVLLCNKFHDVVRGVDPSALIASPSFDNATYMKSYYAAGATQDLNSVNLHIYPNVGVDTGPEAILGYRQTNAKQVIIGLNNGLMTLPVWDSESSWGKNAVATPVSDPQQRAAFVARWLLLHWSAGFARAYWYAWDFPAEGTLFNEVSPGVGTTLPAGVAYQQVQSWMLGANMQKPCSANGGNIYKATYTCTFYRPGGYRAQAVWNANLVCKNGVCGTSNFTPGPMYVQYRDLSGNVHPITAGMPVPIGSRPILLENMTAP